MWVSSVLKFSIIFIKFFDSSKPRCISFSLFPILLICVVTKINRKEIKKGVEKMKLTTKQQKLEKEGDG